MGKFWDDLKAQKLEGNYPFPSSRTVFPVTFATAILCLLMGLAIQTSNWNVKRIEAQYADGPCNCSFPVIFQEFNLHDDWQGPITLFYGIRGFPITRRSFQNSFCQQQLSGEASTEYEFNRTCFKLAWLLDDFRTPIAKEDIYIKEGKKNKYFAPFGSKPNVMFNDTFSLVLIRTKKDNKKWNIPVPLSTENILTTREKESHMWFRINDCNNNYFKDTLKPKYWSKRICEMEGGYQNVDFVVWMRPEANDNFVKMYRRVNLTGMFSGGLPAGRYMMKIENNWSRCNLNVTKSFLLFQPSWYGHKDFIFHKICYLVGFVYIIVGSYMFVRHTLRGQSFEKVAEMQEDGDC